MNAFRDVLDDLASDVRPVDLSPRVTAGVRRRKQRRTVALATVTAGVVALVAFAVPRIDRYVAAPAATMPDGGYVLVWQTGPDPTPLLRGQGADAEARDLGPFTGLAMDLSPDGTRLAYTSEGDVVVRSLADLSTRRYSRPAGVEVLSHVTPVWSPDSSVLAIPYGPDRATRPWFDGVVLLDTTTGSARRIAYPHQGQSVSWAPDGSLLAVTRATGGIDVIDLDGTRVRSFPRKDGGLASAHAWSPDGSRILVSGGPTKTLVLSATTGEVVATLRSEHYVWRDADHVASASFGEITERGLDGEVTGTTRIDLSTSNVFADPALRPAS